MENINNILLKINFKNLIINKINLKKKKKLILQNFQSL
jgi:hypothetical protein